MIELWVGFGVLILGTIFAMVAYFLKRMIEGFDKKLDMIDGKIEFLVIKTTTADNDIDKLKEDVVDIYEEIDKVNDRYEDLHTRLNTIETQHREHHK